MRAITFDQTGNPEEVLKMRNIPIPIPGKGEVRIKVLASPINPADNLFINGKYRIKPNFPQIAGLEGAGIIDQVGEGVSISPGTLAAFRHKNVWAEYAIVPEEKSIPLPEDFPVEKACQVSLNPITAYALIEEAEVKKDDWILLTAGNSTVSKLIIQFAKLKKYKTIAVVRKVNEAAELKSLGATEVISDEIPQILEKVNTLTDGQGVSCILDAVGGELISELIKTIAANGKLLIYGLFSNNQVTYHNSSIIFKNISIKGFGIDQWLSQISNEKYQEMLAVIIDMLRMPEFKLPVQEKLPLDEFEKALEQYQHVGKGKILLTT